MVGQFGDLVSVSVVSSNGCSSDHRSVDVEQSDGSVKRRVTKILVGIRIRSVVSQSGQDDTDFHFFKAIGELVDVY